MIFQDQPSPECVCVCVKGEEGGGVFGHTCQLFFAHVRKTAARTAVKLGIAYDTSISHRV